MSKLIPPVNEHDQILGPRNAAITLVEYGDYQCPYCGEAHPVVKRLQQTLGKKLVVAEDVELLLRLKCYDDAPIKGTLSIKKAGSGEVQ